MKLQKLISKLEKHHKKKLDLSLGRTFNLLKKLGNPQDKLKNVVTVVGTNAKASMCYSLKSILNQAGHKTNLYTSPHLLSYTCLLYTSPSPRDATLSRMPSSA